MYVINQLFPSPASNSLPRGIVTATTVPKGRALPLSLVSALQQKTTTAGTGTCTVDVNKMFTKSFTDHVSISDQ